MPIAILTTLLTTLSMTAGGALPNTGRAAPATHRAPGGSSAHVAGELETIDGRRLRPFRVHVGREPGDRFGAALDTIVDVDGDRVPDLAVGSPRSRGPSGTAPSTGSVRVFSGRTGEELAHWHGRGPGDACGFAVSGAGDVDGDGKGDVLVGSPGGTHPEGAVDLRCGATGRVLYTWTGDADGDGFGRAVAGVGDVNGDRFPDLLVGAPYHDGGGTNAGRASVLSGEDGCLLLSVDGERFDQLGLAVSAAGDVDGDGLADVAIGAPFADAGAFNGGSALVVSPWRRARIGRLDGHEIGELLGHALGASRDGAAPGRALWVGAPGADVGAIDTGRVVLFDPLRGEERLSVPGRRAGEGLFQAAMLPDLDGDEHAELALGSPSSGDREAGHVRVWSPGRGRALAAAPGPEPRSWFGARLVAVGDLDGDGISELAVGAPGHDDHECMGRVFLYRGRDLHRRPGATAVGADPGTADPRPRGSTSGRRRP